MSITEKNGLKINTKLFDFVNNEIIPGTNIKSEEFWNNFGNIVHELAPINKKLIQKREDIQKKIDDWHNKLWASYCCYFIVYICSFNIKVFFFFDNIRNRF